MSQQEVFHFEENKVNFNDLCKEGEFTYWHARDLMGMLGYQSYETFSKAINKAITACMTLNIAVIENFIQDKREIDGTTLHDYRLSRFACYLVAMNADSSKHQVAQAQGFFAATAEAFRQYVEQAEDVERVLIREEITDHEKTLSATAKKAGVANDGYAYFQNAGYRGMYNMNLKALKVHKGIDHKRSPLDFMGKEELAANLFRITQTESKIRNENVLGQKNAERTAENVGKKVRQAMMDISGTTPENLPIGEDIKKVKSALVSSNKEFKKIDKKNKP